MGVNLAVEEVNAAGGVMGRKIELIAEDSVNPQTASTKAQRLIERDKVAAIVGEISSASGLAIAQVAQRNKILFFNTGCNSDELRGKTRRHLTRAEADARIGVGDPMHPRRDRTGTTRLTANARRERRRPYARVGIGASG